MTATILLINPKYPHNVGAVVRAASCLSAEVVLFTGDRVTLTGNRKETRLPREERMRDYQDIDLRHVGAKPFDNLPDGSVPVAVELVPNAEMLTNFEHPEHATYVFGPEDGSLSGMHLSHCHRFVRIPTTHCVNLSAAVYLTLYDRFAKLTASNWPNMYKDGLPDLEDESWLNENLGLRSTR